MNINFKLFTVLSALKTNYSEYIMKRNSSLTLLISTLFFLSLTACTAGNDNDHDSAPSSEAPEFLIPTSISAEGEPQFKNDILYLNTTVISSMRYKFWRPFPAIRSMATRRIGPISTRTE